MCVCVCVFICVCDRECAKVCMLYNATFALSFVRKPVEFGKVKAIPLQAWTGP